MVANALLFTLLLIDFSVMEYFREKYNYQSNKHDDVHFDNYLASVGIHVSVSDNHLTSKGNSELLNGYILANKKVIDALA